MRLQAEIFLTGEHVQPFGRRLGGAFGQQRVHPVRAFQRQAQAAAGGGVEQQRADAAMQIGIEQHGVAAAQHAEMPGEAGGQHRGAGAAMRADHRDHAPARLFADHRAVAERPGTEMPCDHGAADRLGEVFHRAEAARDLPIKVQIVAAADDQHAHIRLHHLRQFGQGAERFAFAGHIDHQHQGGGGFLHRGDGGADAAAPAVDGFGQHFGQAVAQGGFGGGVIDEADDGRAVWPRGGRGAEIVARRLGADIDAGRAHCGAAGGGAGAAAAPACASPPPFRPGSRVWVGRADHSVVTAWVDCL